MEAFDRVAVYSVLAFFFVPSISGDPCGVDRTGKVDLHCDCSDIHLISIFGEWDIRCLQRRLPIADRRARFEKLLVGPFVVAPFINILIKGIITIVAKRWNRCAEKHPCCWFPVTAFHRGLTRILGLIFVYRMDPGFVVRGWAFKELTPTAINVPV